MKPGRPGRRVWWAALLLMLFLPSSLWKAGETSADRVRVTVHEPTDEHADAADIPGRTTARRQVAARLRRTRTPGSSRTD